MTMKKIFGALAAIVAASALALAQKPKSQKELDALKAIQSATTPDARIAAVEDLIHKFADTEFKAWAYELGAESAQMKGDSAKAIVYAELALEADPKNFQSMVIIASELAQGTRDTDLDKEEKLTKAEKYAHQAIDTIATVPPSPLVSPDGWEMVKKDSLGDAHRDLGMIALIRKKYDVAVTEFKMSVDTAANPDPATMVRLATAYNSAGRYDDALATINKVLAVPNLNPVVKQFAENERKRAEQLKAQKK